MARDRENGQAAMTIGQVAAALGVPATTLRYYERERIIGPSDRSVAGYRLCDAAALERIRFLRASQSAGFTLADVRTLLQLSDERPATCCSTVQSLITARLGDVKRKIGDLKRVQEELELALARCRRSRNECPVLTEPSSKRSRGEKR
jgi:DNA-binding transcriptional MerR regulator